MKLALCSWLIALLLILIVLPRANAASAPRSQFRGLWVTAWGHGFKSPAEIDHLIRAAQTAHLNALLVEVRKRGDAYYDSDTEPHAADIPANFDPLAMLIQKAHAVGIQVHAWFVTFPAWSERHIAPPFGHVLRVHPDWATVRKDGHRMTSEPGDTDEGIFLDPGVPQVQDYLVEVIREILTKYDIDGLHLDYIRYPGRQWGYNPIAVQRFFDETGHRPSGAPQLWDQWRRDQVTQLVSRIAKEVQATRPAACLSAAVFPDHSASYTERLQDWEQWMRRGLVDFVAPMNYATTRSRFASRSAALLNRGGIRPVYMGVGGGNKSEAMVLQQMQLLQSKGALGIIFYHYDGTSPEFWRRLGSRIYSRPAIIPDLSWKQRTSG